MSHNLDQLCSECGHPEKGSYTCPPGRTFTCSRCVHNMLVRMKKDDEEKIATEKEVKKARQKELANRPTRMRRRPSRRKDE